MQYNSKDHCIAVDKSSITVILIEIFVSNHQAIFLFGLGQSHDFGHGHGRGHRQTSATRVRSSLTVISDPVKTRSFPLHIMNELFLVCIGSFDFLSRSDSNRTDSFDILSDGDGTGD